LFTNILKGDRLEFYGQCRPRICGLIIKSAL